jgi:hypothetical protein
VWAEGGKYPNVIIEILSKSTAKVDRTKKKDLYQNIFRTPNYFWFDPESLEFRGFTLRDGQYQSIASDDRGYLWSDELGLYLGVFAGKLRYFTESGELVPTPEEFGLQALLAKEQAVVEKEQAVLEKERERQEKNKLAQKLREMGIDPDTI